jgi:hypothetical protein
VTESGGPSDEIGKNQHPMSQQVRHDKHPYLLIALTAEHRLHFCSPFEINGNGDIPGIAEKLLRQL